MAAFTGIGPAPPPPKPPRDLSEYSQIAEDPDGLRKELNKDESSVDA
jgi:hypothetical protein